MRHLRLVAALVLASCEPLSGYTVEDRAGPEVAVLPMRCLDSVARTSGGLWVCRTTGGVFASRGDAVSVQLVGSRVAAAGAAVWTWAEPYTGAVVIRYQDEPTTGGLTRSPDAGFDWHAGGSRRQSISSVLAYEDRVVLGTAGVRVVGARDGGLELLSATSGTFRYAGGIEASPDVLFETRANDLLWASGPRLEATVLCAFNFAPGGGISGTGQCTALPPVWRGPGSGASGLPRAAASRRSSSGRSTASRPASSFQGHWRGPSATCPGPPRPTAA
jgi:hypothetical protein